MKVFIAIPSYTGTIAAECMLSVVGLIEVLNSELGGQSMLTIHSYNGNVADARNRLVQGFLTSDCTHILFVDDDMQFVPEEVFRMLSGFTSNTLAVIAALCPRKNTKGAASEYDMYHPPADESLYGKNVYVHVDRVGTGIMVIPRKVFLDTAPNVVRRATDGMPQYFLTLSGVRDVSEDYYFCDRVRSCGIDIFLAMWTDVKHIGRYAFGGLK